MENADVREISQIIYHSKGLDESYQKIQVLSNLSNYVKSYGHFSEILAFLPQALTKYDQITSLLVTIFEICNFHFIWHKMLGIVTRFRLCSFITSKVIGKKLRAWWKTPPSPYRVKEDVNLTEKSYSQCQKQ